MKINFAQQQKLLIAALVISVCATLYPTFWFLVYAGAEKGPGYHLDRSHGDRYVFWVIAGWSLVIVLFYCILRRAEKAAMQKYQHMKNAAFQNAQKSSPPSDTN